MRILNRVLVQSKNPVARVLGSNFHRAEKIRAEMRKGTASNPIFGNKPSGESSQSSCKRNMQMNPII